jgi:hypothetical protein
MIDNGAGPAQNPQPPVLGPGVVLDVRRLGQPVQRPVTRRDHVAAFLGCRSIAYDGTGAVHPRAIKRLPAFARSSAARFFAGRARYRAGDTTRAASGRGLGDSCFACSYAARAASTTGGGCGSPSSTSSHAMTAPGNESQAPAR